MKKICILVPVYNEESCIQTFYDTTKLTTSKIEGYEFDFMFVDDGSKDKTLVNIKAIEGNDVKFISFSRNFGKEAAFLAGLRAIEQLEYDGAIMMDVDLQDDPKYIKDMIEKYEEGYHHIKTHYNRMHSENFVLKFLTWSFYKVFSILTGFKSISHGSRDYAFLDKNVVKAYISFEDKNRFTKGIAEYVGFKTFTLSIDYQDRSSGNSKWNVFSLLKYGFTGIDAFSNWLKLIPFLVGLAYTGLIIYDIYNYFMIANSTSININMSIYSYSIRQDCMMLCICLISSAIIRLIYKNKDNSDTNKVFFIEEQNF